MDGHAPGEELPHGNILVAGSDWRIPSLSWSGKSVQSDYLRIPLNMMINYWLFSCLSVPFTSSPALPMCSIARAYSKQLLHDAFSLLLFPESSAHQGDGYQGEAALTTLRQVHHLAEEARSMLHANMKSLGTVVDTSDSGESGEEGCW